MGKLVISFLILAGTLAISCRNNESPDGPGKLTLQFSHLIDDKEIIFDDLAYTNAAGNIYEVSEIQWFISDITLINDQNEEFLLDEGGFAHYVDTDISETQTWELPDEIEPGNYKSIKITFGIKGEKNIPYFFPNSPESDMQWPYNLGGDNGGYHYMKLNGFWINTSQERTPFNFHIGVGQEYDNEGNVTAFIQNWFEQELPGSAFTMVPGGTQHINIVMNVEDWFQNPHAYDHNVFGGKIMKNQEAMRRICENGKDVFTVRIFAKGEGLNGL